MIRITKGATNSCVFTLTEKTTLSNADYIIRFFSNQNHDNKLMFLNNDISPNKTRYNLFEIEETTNENLNNQKIELEETTYDYFIYETISATLSLDYAGDIVESGKVKVIGAGTASYTYNNQQQEYTFE